MDSPDDLLETLCSFIPGGQLRDALTADIRHISMQYCNVLGEYHDMTHIGILCVCVCVCVCV